MRQIRFTTTFSHIIANRVDDTESEKFCGRMAGRFSLHLFVF